MYFYSPIQYSQHTFTGPRTKVFELIYIRGAGLPNKKDGSARQKFWKEPQRVTKILLCGRGITFSSPIRRTNSYKTHFFLSYFFGSVPKRVPQKLPLTSFWGWTPYGPLYTSRGWTPTRVGSESNFTFTRARAGSIFIFLQASHGQERWTAKRVTFKRARVRWASVYMKKLKKFQPF